MAADDTRMSRRARWRLRPRVVGAVLLVLFAAAVTGPAASAAAGEAGRPASEGLPSARVVTPPTPVAGTDARRHLVYEVLVENDSRGSARLDRLVVRDPDRGIVLATHRGRALAGLMAQPDGRTGTRTIPKRRVGLLPLDVSLRPGRTVPSRLVNRLSLTLSDGAGHVRRLTTTTVTRVVRRKPPLTISPPLHGRSLGVLGCCGRPFAHRLAAATRTPRSRLPVFAQRYAIDFVRLDDRVNSLAGDPKRNESYLIYGAEVAAAAPGRVVATRDGVPENTPPATRPGTGPNDLAGNFVNQDLGGGRFALYGHMQPGSLRVRPGDQVQRGQVLGLVGNTGNSSEPHLHFHVMDAPGGASNLAADGVPYVFDGFRLEGRLTGLAADPPAPARAPAPPPAERSGQYPLTGDVVAFP